MPDTSLPASTLQIVGALCFGAIIGWYLYYINRYRTSQVDLADLVTVIGAIGGGAVLTLFPERTDLFGAYGIGLAIGFFGYFIVLTILVSLTRNFSVDFFLDGRRKKPADDEIAPGYTREPDGTLKITSANTAMGDSPSSGGPDV
ncbi:MAG: hypothetical protein Fur005_19510 [Roseiflexaceae bacterium]